MRTAGENLHLFPRFKIGGRGDHLDQSRSKAIRKGTMKALSLIKSPIVLSAILIAVFAGSLRAETIFNAGFGTGSDGFVYGDDRFEGTSKPAYASGNYVASGGYSGGGLRVLLGGVDDSTVVGMSGGWSRGFSLSSASLVRVSLRYRLVLQGTYEGDEFGKALVSIDGVLHSPDGTGVLWQFWGDDPQTNVIKDSGWRQAVFDVSLSSGSHTVVVGGFNNKKTRKNEYMELFFDDVELIVIPPESSLFSAGFDTGSDGFSYSDDLFGTNNPAYASGGYRANGGYSGGGLSVKVGGVDSVAITNGMSGGWSRGFDLSSGGVVKVTLRYRLVFSQWYDPGECGAVLVAIDSGEPRVLYEICDGGGDSGWRQVSFEENLSAGAHLIKVGGYNNQKTTSAEVMDVYFDDIEVSAAALYFVDDFESGQAANWSVIDDSGMFSNWFVSGGRYHQSHAFLRTFSESYLLGALSVFSKGYDLADYEAQVTIYPPDDVETSTGDVVGLLFRYLDQNNYYRVSISRKQGFSRLEKRSNGVFQTLSLDGRGFETGEPISLTVCVKGPVILVYYNEEPLFGAVDHDHPQGTIALLTGGVASFDDILIRANDPSPRVVVGAPNSFSVAVNDASPTRDLTATAFAINLPSGAGIRFTLDKGTSGERAITRYQGPHTAVFTDLDAGEHTLEAWAVNSGGNLLDCTYCVDNNIGIGIGGKYLVAYGDSITSGKGDDIESDDISMDGRNLSRGYSPILNDFITSSFGKPVTIANEGLGGTTSSHGAMRLQSTLERHPDAQIFLIQFGTNDAINGFRSGSGLTLGQPGYAGSFKAFMQDIVAGVLGAGKEPALAKVPIALGSCSTCPYFSNPDSEALNVLIREFNQAIDELIQENDLFVETPPDFYAHFRSNRSEFYDPLHPNGVGYYSMAELWHEKLSQSDLFSE